MTPIEAKAVLKNLPPHEKEIADALLCLIGHCIGNAREEGDYTGGDSTWMPDFERTFTSLGYDVAHVLENASENVLD